MRQLHDLDVPSRIYNFIGFLISKRNLFFQHDLSKSETCGVGVPQGGVLSPIIFNLILRELFNQLPLGVKAEMNADDLLIHVRFTSAAEAIDLLNTTVAILSGWLGYAISVSKCQLALFSRSQINAGDIELVIDGQTLTAVNSIMYHGIILDRKLSWLPHIKYIAGRATAAVNVLKAMAKVSWGADPSSLLMAYRGLVRAHLEWGAPLFMCASQTNLKILDKIQYSALSVVLGYMITTPISVLLSECDKPPLYLRRLMLTDRFLLRCAAWRANPLIFKLQLLYERSLTKKFRNFNFVKLSLFSSYIRIRGLLGKLEKSKKVLYYDYNWDEISQKIHIDIHSGLTLKGQHNSEQLLNDFLISEFNDSTAIFTDGAHDERKKSSGAAFFIPEHNFRYGIRINGIKSPISTEMTAIASSLKHIAASEISKAIIITDSRSALQGIQDVFRTKSTHPLILKIIKMVYSILELGKVIGLLWVPSHSGIMGNLEADRLAKLSMYLNVGPIGNASVFDFKDLLFNDYKSWYRSLWPHARKVNSAIKYFSRIGFKDKRPWFRGYDAPRREINAVTRLRTSHVCTGEHFNKMNWRIDVGCQCGFDLKTLRHLFIECPRLSNGRPAFFSFLSTKYSSFNTDTFDFQAIFFFAKC
ncbi:uncharacterized protein LOC127287259 [Leptopilina boulardi]|uniref:uncharacterized protein LOC127287259 n=1 Tax=Leptopilina boulardi TaxID=63433 RepID=UPI0021F5F699|nr:uncharacterized protein LOC127287259 [Leptopilina boulardi]